MEVMAEREILFHCTREMNENYLGMKKKKKKPLLRYYIVRLKTKKKKKSSRWRRFYTCQ